METVDIDVQQWRLLRIEAGISSKVSVANYVASYLYQQLIFCGHQAEKKENTLEINYALGTMAELNADKQRCEEYFKKYFPLYVLKAEVYERSRITIRTGFSLKLTILKV